ncbi:MAG: glycosyltransferase [Limnohabitans sp.]|nr:glycosyltransferase [Limnohabitans sp.]
MLSFLIVTHVPHIQVGGQYFAYAPYVREMNIWLKYVDKVIVVAPKSNNQVTKIEESYNHPNVEFIQLESFNILNFSSIIKSLFSIPKNLITILKAIKKANHIHLRCPGNVGLLGVMAQVFYPSKTKTAKYAGNWDPDAKTPFSYKLQKNILENTFLTRNMQVLVYGNWQNSTKNIKSFFTATYRDLDIIPFQPKGLKGKIKFLFAGMLTEGKQPLYALQLVEKLKNEGKDVELSFFGDGVQRAVLEEYIKLNKLENFVYLKGNQNLETLKEAYQESHFVVLPSLSEGWPKVIAEGMFWGCVPIASKVSCVPNMLNNEERGVLLDFDLDKDCQKLFDLLQDESVYQKKQLEAVNWSRKYTTDYFEQEIKQLLIQ